MDCQRATAYNKPHCHNCGNDSFDTTSETRGKLVAISTIQETPPDVQSPHHIGLITFENGASVIAQLDQHIDPITEVQIADTSDNSVTFTK